MSGGAGRWENPVDRSIQEDTHCARFSPEFSARFDSQCSNPFETSGILAAAEGVASLTLGIRANEFNHSPSVSPMGFGNLTAPTRTASKRERSKGSHDMRGVYCDGDAARLRPDLPPPRVAEGETLLRRPHGRNL